MKKLIFLFISLLVSNFLLYSQDKIAMVIASQHFRDEEFFIPKNEFEHAGFKVLVFSSRKGTCTGMLGGQFQVNHTLEDLNIDDFVAIIFVGGVGAQEYWNNPLAHNICKEAYNKNKIVGAICIAPVILANAGILKNKKATCWPSEKEKLKHQGAIFTGKGVEQDGNIITAVGPRFAKEFALKIIKSIKEKKQ